MIHSALVHFQRPSPTLNASGSGPAPALAWTYAKAPSTPPRLGAGAYIGLAGAVRCFRGEGTRVIVPLVDEDPGTGGNRFETCNIFDILSKSLDRLRVHLWRW